ncbi:uncharacterized protein LOC109863813 [Pseudomyrmex gracilis]|uniref:uncharacterized protein LOC109863813 n=1 Tax=Pseudomyrmex gracilis TaxID=219809 RepID=UPI000994E3E5|nr:uncharacterized protein LOC109863813 [Pseudomyrmex gracilis]
MQAAGMLRGTRAISLLVLLVPLIDYAYSSPLQYLPNIPGYIPVYVRYGDEPLEEINPELAEAFGETSSSVKSLQKIDRTLAHETDNFKDDDLNVFLEESKSKHAYPLHVREAESRSFANVDSDDSNKPKLLTIYTLPDDKESRPRRRNRERNRMKSWKPPAFKVSPLSDEEKEELKKLAIEVEEEETKPNEFYFPNFKNGSPAPSDKAHSRHKTLDFLVPLKVQSPFDDDSLANLPDIPQITDPPQSSDDVATSEDDKQEPPVKQQRPSSLLSNVDKMSPVDPLEDSKLDEANRFEFGEENPLSNEANLPKIDQTAEKQLTKKVPEISDDTNDVTKSNDCDTVSSKSNKKDFPVKVQRPDSILSNVDKLSPVDLPDESESTQNEARNSTELSDEMIADS